MARWLVGGRYTRDAVFRNSEPHVACIFGKLAHLARRCGAVRVYPQKTLSLASEDDVDAEVARWMRRAYRIERQEHLK